MLAKVDPKQRSPERKSPAMSAFYLTEVLAEIDRGAGFLDTLSLAEVDAVRSAASAMVSARGETIFHQGDPNRGIYLIEQGRVRTYYSSPTGREITLAYWTPGHFVGGPEVFGRGAHMWSGEAVERCRLAYLPGPAVRRLATTIPAFSICLIEGLIAKRQNALGKMPTESAKPAVGMPELLEVEHDAGPIRPRLLGGPLHCKTIGEHDGKSARPR